LGVGQNGVKRAVGGELVARGFHALLQQVAVRQARDIEGSDEHTDQVRAGIGVFCV